MFDFSLMIEFLFAKNSLRSRYQRQSRSGLPAVVYAGHSGTRIHTWQVLDVHVRRSLSVCRGLFHSLSGEFPSLAFRRGCIVDWY